MYAPQIALGTWSWGTGIAGGDQVFGNHLDVHSLNPVFDAALQAGLNVWDTAAVYGMGSSESLLGEFVRQYPRKDLVLSTKFTPQIANTASVNPVEDMFRQSCDRLGTDYIDIYWIHNPSNVNAWTHYFLPLLKAGRVKKIGVSNHNLQEIKMVNATLAQEGFAISAVQNHYSLLYRESEKAGILEYCKANSITFFAYMVLEQGALSGKYNASNPLPAGSGRGDTYNKILPALEGLTNAMRDMAQAKNASVAQIAIAWAIAKSTVPLIGVTKPHQVADAACAKAIALTAEEVFILERLAEGAAVDTRGSWENKMAVS